MSFSTNLDNYSYQGAPPTCNTCYDLDKTPSSIFLCFTGIKIGNLWIPTDPPPPNGNFEIPISADCRWTASIGPWDFWYGLVVGRTLLTCATPLGMIAFTSQIPILCLLSMENQILNPVGNKFYGGSCQVVPPLEGGPWSIPDLMALISDDPNWAQWLNPKPVSADLTVYKLYDQTNSVNVKIKIDHS